TNGSDSERIHLGQFSGINYEAALAQLSIKQIEGKMFVFGRAKRRDDVTLNRGVEVWPYSQAAHFAQQRLVIPGVARGATSDSVFHFKLPQSLFEGQNRVRRWCI